MTRVLAQRADSFLIQVGEGCARVFDARHHRLFPPVAIETVLARGYWQEFRGVERDVLDQLASVEVEEIGTSRPGQASLSAVHW